MTAIELARAFALQEVELPEPPGLQARLRLLPLDEAMRKGMVRGELRAAVLKAIGDSAAETTDSSQLSDDQVQLGLNVADLQLCEMVRAIRVGPDTEWEPVRLTLENFEEILPPATVKALRDIAEGRKTPAMVTAIVRRMRGEISEEEAVAIVEAETPKLASSWDSFRVDTAGAGSGDNGTGVGPKPKRAAQGD